MTHTRDTVEALGITVIILGLLAMAVSAMFAFAFWTVQVANTHGPVYASLTGVGVGLMITVVGVLVYWVVQPFA